MRTLRTPFPRCLAALQMRSWSARLLSVFICVVGGLGISLLLFEQAQIAQRRELEHALVDHSDHEIEVLELQLTRSTEVLHSIGSLFQTKQEVTAGEFAIFVTDALKRQPELLALGWSPWRRATEFEPETVRVKYIEPLPRNAAAVGFDLWSSEPRRQTLALARDGGQPVATPPLRLVQEPKSAAGFIVFLPVYRDAPPVTIAQRRQSLLGYVSAVFRAPDLLDSFNQSNHRGPFAMSLRDQASGILLAGDTGIPVVAFVQRTLDIAGRRWELTVSPGHTFIAKSTASIAWRTLGVGTILSLLMGAYLYAILSRTRHVEQRVRERTAQLSAEIVERTRAEEAARSAQQQYRSIFENSVEGIFQSTPDGHYLNANRALARLYGHDSPEQLIRDLSNIAHQLYVEPGRRDEFIHLIRANGVVTEFDSQIYRWDGEIIWIRENARAVCDERGDVLHYEGFVVDVTHRKQAEAMQARAREELEERVRERTLALAAANTAKSRFLASMSHEIRTPMNAILGYTQILHRDRSAPSAHRDAIASILSSGKHLLGLIDGILDLSRIEAGHVSIDQSLFDLAAMAQDLERMFTNRCQERGISLRVRTIPGRFIGDERKIRQVLINLVGNAVRFTDKGEVALDIRRSADSTVCFTVSDTGIGIDPQDLSRIFEPFQQGQQPSQRGGSGLGLALAQQHVRLMQGELTARSQLRIGSQFSFSIPITPAEANVEPNEPAWDSASLAPDQMARVLIVDDVEQNRHVLAQLLESAGFTVYAANSCRQAIDFLANERTPIDLALIDILMPDQDGFETSNVLRAQPGGEAMPLIAMSAAVFAHDQSRYAAAGFSQVLAKPIACKSLFSAIAHALGVTFIFDNPPEEPSLWSMKAAMAQTESLPVGLRRRLREAVENSSFTDLKGCAEEFETQACHDLARCLRQSLQTFDFSAIESLLHPMASAIGSS